MAEYSRLAKGHFTSTGNAQPIFLPFQPDRVEMVNYSLASAGVAASKIISAKWDVSMGQGFAVIEGYSSGSALIYDVVTVNGISSFAQGLSLQYGPNILLGTANGAGIAKTSSTVLTVTVNSANAIQVGNWITFNNLYQTSTTGMQQIAGIPFQVLSVTQSSPTTIFTIGWVGNSSNLTAITTAATGAAGFQQILYPALYVPGVAFPWSISQTSGVVTVNTTAPHNYQIGQEIAFRIPSAYGAQQLNELPNNVIPGSPNYFYVVSVPSPVSFTFNYSGPLTAFNVNQPFASFPGLKFAEVIATGDVNSGGFPYSGGSLYPSPTVYQGYSLSANSTINGPAIQGAFINATAQGFIIGTGAGAAITAGSLVGANGNVIYWAAYLDDLSVN